MNVLEKILEEIESEAMTNKEVGRKQCEGMARAMNIIRSYMRNDTYENCMDDELKNKIKDMKKLRLSYYQRNNIPIPEEDYLVKEIEKWNWFTKGILSKIAVLYLRYVDGRSCKYRKEGRKYLKYSNPYKTWIPATGYAFFLGAVRDVYIEDFNGRVYMFSYSDSEMKRLQDY